MKKIIVGSIATILLLSGCSKSAEECREEGMELAKDMISGTDPEAYKKKMDDYLDDCGQYK